MRAPMGPPPKTSTASPGPTLARVTSWVAIANGSITAACSSVREAGTLMMRSVGTAQYSCMPPGTSTPRTLSL